MNAYKHITDRLVASTAKDLKEKPQSKVKFFDRLTDPAHKDRVAQFMARIEFIKQLPH